MTERSVFRSCDLWGVGWDSIQVPGSGSNSGRCKKVCTAGARDSIHAPGHGSNPDGRCKRVNTVPMSYHNTLVLWQKNLCRRCSVAFIETSIQVTWPVLTNQRPVLRSRDLYWPIRSQHSGHVIRLDQSEANIKVTWPVLTNQRPVFKSLRSDSTDQRPVFNI